MRWEPMISVGVFRKGPPRQERQFLQVGLDHKTGDLPLAFQVIGDSPDTVITEHGGHGGIAQITVHQKGVEVQIMGDADGEIGRHEGFPFSLKGAGDHDGFHRPGQVKPQELRPQFAELLRNERSGLVEGNEDSSAFKESKRTTGTAGSGIGLG